MEKLKRGSDAWTFSADNLRGRLFFHSRITCSKKQEKTELFSLPSQVDNKNKRTSGLILASYAVNLCVSANAVYLTVGNNNDNKKGDQV